MNQDIYTKDEFWYNKPSILLEKDRLLEFIPSSKMTFTEKLNAVVRFGIYLSVILFLVKLNYLFFYIPLVLLVITYGIHMVTTSKESFQEEYHEKKKVPCSEPTFNNPFMNVLLTDYRNNPTKNQACNEKIDPTIRNKINRTFNFNLYQDVDDVYGKGNSQRQFFTMPYTTIPNDQETFASWLYKSPKTLKESSICNTFGVGQCPDPNLNGFRRRNLTEVGSTDFEGLDPSL